jgi:hypothetical protein
MSRLIVTVAASILLTACGGDDDGGSGSKSGSQFALSGNLQTFQGIRGTTIATSTSSAPLTISGDNISWQASSTVPWIQLQTTSGTSAGALPFTVNPSGLPVGTSEGTIRITDSNSAVTLNATVSVTVRSLGFSVTPSVLTLDVDSTTTSIEPPTFTVADELNGQSGAAGYTWTVKSPTPYVTVTPSTGNTATTTSVNVQFSGVLNAALGGFTSALSVSASGNGSTGATVTVNANVQLPRAHAVFPNILEPGPAVVKLIGRNFQDADVARLRVNGAAPVSATRVSDRVIDVDLGVLAAGQYVFTFDNPLGLTRSVAELTVTPRAPAAGPGEIASNHARQRLLFDSHRGVLYASNVEAGAIQRFSHDGASWQELAPIPAGSVTDIDFSSNARWIYGAGPHHLKAVDLSQPAPAAKVSTPTSLNCGNPLAGLITVAALPTGTVHGYPTQLCRVSGTSISVAAIGQDLLLGGEVLPPRDTFPNDEADLFRHADSARVSGDRRYVATTTSLWDSHTGQFLYSSLQNTQAPASVDLHATKVLLGGTVVDRTGTLLCTLPLDPTPFTWAAVLSADGSRVYFYQPGASSSDIHVLSTAQSGTPAAPGVCATATASIAVPNVGGVRPDPLLYGNSTVYAMTVSDDDSLLFLSGSSRILVIDTP